MSRVHDEFVWLDKLHKISKGVIPAIKGLCEYSQLQSLKATKNDVVTNKTDSKFDGRVMTIDDILENDIRFASMVIGYKIYYSRKINSIFGIAIYATHEMLKENKKYDLCMLLRSELMKNLKKIK